MAKEQNTNNTHQSLTGLFERQLDLQNALSALQEEGFPSKHVCYMHRGINPEEDFGISESSRAPQGWTIGSITGIAGGGAVGYLAGAGQITLPGSGLLVASGPLLGLLSAAAVAGTGLGLLGVLIGLGFTKFTAEGISDKLDHGAMLLAVITETEREKELARRVMEKYGAADVAPTRLPIDFLSAPEAPQNKPEDYDTNSTEVLASQREDGS